MLKKVMLCLLSLIIVLGSATACNMRDPNDDGSSLVPEEPDSWDTELQVSYFLGGYGSDWFVWLKNEFQRQNPGVRVVLDGDPNMDTMIVTNVENGLLIPDVCFLGSEYLWKRWGPQGYLLELSELYSETVPGTDKTLEELMLPHGKALADYPRPDGSTERYIVPWGDATEGIVYNKAILDDYYGTSDWTFPATWSEFLALCDGLKAKGIAPLTYPGTTPGYLSSVIMPIIAQYFGDEDYQTFMNPDETFDTALYGDSAIEKGFQYTQELISRGYLLTGSQSLTHTLAQQKFVQGECAMIINGSWLQNEVKNILPDGFEMRMAPIPAMPDAENSTRTANIGNVAFSGVLADSQNIELAKKFLLFSCSPDAQKAFYRYCGAWRPFDIDLSDVEVSGFTESCRKVWEDETVYKSRMYSSSPFFVSLSAGGSNYADLATMNANGTMRYNYAAIFNRFSTAAKSEYNKLLNDFNSQNQ